MLQFKSASTRAVDGRRAILECLEIVSEGGDPDWDLVLINAATGHDVGSLSEHLRRLCPRARVLATSCAGTVGREGPGESMRDIAIMAIRGEGYTVAHVDQLYRHSSFDKGAELGRALLAAPRPVHAVYLLATGIDIANDRVIAGLESVLGPDVVLFGATSSDEMKGVATHQAIDGQSYQHAAFAVGIWDPMLEVDTQATHGFRAVGEPMEVTAAEGNRILALDGRAAWPAYLERLGLEALIFAGMDRMMGEMVARRPGQRPVAVFQADRLARGRRLFHRILKKELVSRMRHPLSHGGDIPPWFGMYGFGEYARLDRNAYHNYTSALAAPYRNER